MEDGWCLLAQLPCYAVLEVIRALERPGTPLAEAVLELVGSQMQQKRGQSAGSDEGLVGRVSELLRAGQWLDVLRLAGCLRPRRGRWWGR